MKNSIMYSHMCSKTLKTSFGYKPILSSQYSGISKSHISCFKKLISSQDELSCITPEICSKSRKNFLNEIQTQAHKYISLIKDPLWKKVCIEFINQMGSSQIPPIWESKLGVLSPQNPCFNLYCPTEEVSQFTQQYSFIILNILQQYFPNLKDINRLPSRRLD